MTAPDFDAMARDFIPAHQADSDEDAASALSALLRSVHASRDAEVSAAREQGIREAALVECGHCLCEQCSQSRDRILALLNAPKGG